MDKITIKLKDVKLKKWLPKYDDLANLMLNAREKSYSPYSKFKVGAALLSNDGTVFSGCNIENASFGVTNCAERTALFKAISEGHKDFKLIMIGGAPSEIKGCNITPPCGVCRQALLEFCDLDDFYIIMPEINNKLEIVNYEIRTLREVMPMAFTL